MPCYDPMNTAEYGRQKGYKEGYDAAMREARHNSPVAELLCKTIKHFGDVNLPLDVKKWWKEHQLRDKKKKER